MFLQPANSVAVIGPVSVTQGTSPWVTNDPGLPDTLGQKAMAGSTGVVIASDQTSIPVAATVGNFPATQAVTQSTSPWVVNDPGLPDALGQAAAAGSTSVVLASDQPAVPVSGTFFQTTQPVSVVSLPLPTNASIETGGFNQRAYEMLAQILYEHRMLNMMIAQNMGTRIDLEVLREDPFLVPGV